MNQTPMFLELVRNFAYQFPTFVVCLIAAFLILTRWKQLQRAGLWALLGFGVVLVLCLVVPLLNTAVHFWMIQGGGHSAQQVGMVYSVLGIVWSLLHAVGYGFLLAAILTGRDRTAG